MRFFPIPLKTTAAVLVLCLVTAAGAFAGGRTERSTRDRLKEAEALIEEQHAGGGLSDGKRQEFLVYIYQVRAHEISRGGRFLDALQSIQEAIALLGADEKLLQSLSVYRKNYEAKVHNSMVEAYREGRYEEAARIVEAGLERLPDSAALKKDLELLEEAAASGE